MKKKLFISQPMANRTEEEIKFEKEKIIEEVRKIYGDIDVIDSYIEDSPEDASGIWYLAKSIEMLDEADIVYFAYGWQLNRGCIIEHEVCKRYDKTIIKD